jgi:hypothetical protein
MYLSNSFQDDSEMTLQVALEASDGFLIASDTRAISGLLRCGSTVQKILIAENMALVSAFSGNHLSVIIAQGLIKSAPQQFNSDAEVSNYLYEKIADCVRAIGVPEKQEILVGIPNAIAGVHRLWWIYFDKQPCVMCVRDKVYGGIESDPAIYLTERYYRNECSVSDLMMLAAHMIIEGHNLDGINVAGLDVLVSKDGENPRLLDPKEIKELGKRSNSIHEQISHLFFPR